MATNDTKKTERRIAMRRRHKIIGATILVVAIGVVAIWLTGSGDKRNPRSPSRRLPPSGDR